MIFIVIFVGGYCLCGITFQILSFKYLDKRIKYFEACTNISSLQYEFKNIKSLIGLMSFQGFLLVNLMINILKELKSIL